MNIIIFMIFQNTTLSKIALHYLWTYFTRTPTHNLGFSCIPANALKILYLIMEVQFMQRFSSRICFFEKQYKLFLQLYKTFRDALYMKKIINNQILRSCLISKYINITAYQRSDLHHRSNLLLHSIILDYPCTYPLGGSFRWSCLREHILPNIIWSMYHLILLFADDFSLQLP